MDETPHSERGWILALRVATVPLMLVAGGIAFCVWPNTSDVSELEKRRLAPLPGCAASELQSGACTRGIDLYVADHFPMRETMVFSALWMKDHRGLPVAADEVRVVPYRDADEGGLERVEDWEPLAGATAGEAPRDDTDPPDVAANRKSKNAAPGRPGRNRPRPSEARSIALLRQGWKLLGDGLVEGALELKRSLAALPEPSTVPPPETNPAPAPSTAPLPAAEEGAVVTNGILVNGDRAMQMFGGSSTSARLYAEVVNDFARKVKPGVRVHSVVVPTAISFYAPASRKVHSNSERANLDEIGRLLAPGVTHADTFSSLAAHTAEPIYLRTDHHWNGLGAYYAYVAFCAAAGLQPVPLDRMAHGTKPGFVGSMFAFTGDSRLREHPDVVDYYEPPVTYTATRQARIEQKPSPARFLEKGAHGYGVFLGGDHALMVARTEAGTGRRALIIKNSYGNPFSVLLLPHFDEVLVVDYRRFNGSLADTMAEHAITDLVLFNVTITANAAPHRKRMAALSTSFVTSPLPSASPKPRPTAPSSAPALTNAPAPSPTVALATAPGSPPSPPAAGKAPAPVPPPPAPAPPPDPREQERTRMLKAGLGLAAEGKPAPAIYWLRKSLAIGFDAQGARELGKAFYMIDKLAPALEWLQKATQANAADAEAYLYQGMILAELDRRPAARQAYERFLELEPNGPRAREIRVLVQSMQR